ncbi:MAG: response regulator [Candidatus Kapaibacterium sp.]|nr:response regulator [Bacteroidota bacterium]
MYDAQKFTILIVDDIPQNIQVAATALRSDGFNVSFATSGEEALERVQSIKPDVILLDVMMPGMDGYEVCEKLKANPATNNIPIIFLTALNEIDAAVKGFELGAVDFVNKPFNNAELLARVNTHCKVGYLQRIVNEKNQILEDINASLEMHVANRTQELEASLHQEKRFNQMTMGLIGLISHEFRTPMTIIQNGVELMHYADTLPAEEANSQRDKIGTQITDSITIMTNHLESISDMLRTHTTLIHEQPVEMMINAYIHDTVTQFNKRFMPKQNVELSLPQSEIVGFIMPDNLSMAITQLLKNAIKYSPDFSTVTVRMMAEQNLMRISVEDEGKGITPEDERSMYEWFHRGMNETQMGSTRGLGLGLALVRMCVDTMQGSIQHEQRPTGGTRFTISVPIPQLEVSGDYTQLAAQLGVQI